MPRMTIAARVGMTMMWLVAGIVCPSAGMATTFVRMDEWDLVNSSAVIVVGTVSGIEAAELVDGSIVTYVHVQPSEFLKGKAEVGGGPVVLREPGGVFGGRREWLFGAPQYSVGDEVLVFLARSADGALRTNAMALGKYAIGFDANGSRVAVRDPGEGASVLDPETGQIAEAASESEPLEQMLQRVRDLVASTADDATDAVMPIQAVPQELADTPTEVQEAYTFLGPARWIEPDSGQPISYLIDQTGYAGLGFDASRAAVDAALAAWTSVPTASITLVDGGTTAPTAYSGCGFNRIIFNDPYGEIPDPSGCSGVLAVGGFCTVGQQSVVNGTTFARIVVGKITFNNGWEQCNGWTACNLAEVATHELGHTIGLGHSTDSAATMRASAHFDGRCAGLAADDVAGVTFLYPAGVPDTPAPTPTGGPATPTPTFTPTPTAPAPAATPTPVVPPTATPTRIPTRIPTGTPTPSGTATPTPGVRHDAVVAPLRPKTLRITTGHSTATAVVRVKVTNVGGQGGTADQIQLVADAGDCPAGTVDGAPDFASGIPGDQDQVTLKSGASKNARVHLKVDQAAFTGRAGRCTLRFTAVTVSPAGSVDPSPANNTAVLELNVVDANQGQTSPVLGSLAPVKLTIARGATAATYAVWPQVGVARRNASGGSIAVAVADTDCPAGMLQGSDVSGGQTGTAAPVVVLAARPDMVNATNPRSPSRCEARLRATGPGVDDSDPTATATLVIDVLDKNDL